MKKLKPSFLLLLMHLQKFICTWCTVGMTAKSLLLFIRKRGLWEFLFTLSIVAIVIYIGLKLNFVFQVSFICFFYPAHIRFCYTARGGFCYSEEDIFEFGSGNGTRSFLFVTCKCIRWNLNEVQSALLDCGEVDFTVFQSLKKAFLTCVASWNVLRCAYKALYLIVGILFGIGRLWMHTMNYHYRFT